MIGVFDSGIGGLTALKELTHALPYEDFVYLADEAHLPYGAHTRADVLRYTASALAFFESLGVHRVLLACGTASALAFDFCKHNFAFPIHNVIEPACIAASEATKSHRIGIAATEATTKSGVFPKALHRYAPAATVTAIACPYLVSLAEAAEHDPVCCYRAVREYLAPMRREKIDTLILGCTHFSMLRDAISAFLPGVTIIDSGKEAARALALDALSPPFMAEAALDCRGKKREHPRERGGRLRLYTTLDARALSRYASAVLERPVHAQKIEPV